MHTDIDILIIITKIFSEYGQPANVFCILLYFQLEFDGTAVIKPKFVYRHIRNLKAVYEGSGLVYHQDFQQTVLVPVRVPPVRGKDSLYSTEIPRAGPCGDLPAI